MIGLEELQGVYERTLAAYRERPSESNRQAYKDAAEAFASARREQKLIEEADPDHPRGNVFAATTLEVGE